jgi:hypothetical protein
MYLLFVLLSWVCYGIGVVFIYWVGCVCCYLVFNSCDVSNIGLCVSRYVSFMRRLSLLNLYMWYFSSVFGCPPPPFCCFYDVHYVGYCPVCMSCVQCMIWVFGITVINPDCLYVLFVSGAKCSAGLTYVYIHLFQWAILTFHCMNITFFLFVYFWVEP